MGTATDLKAIDEKGSQLVHIDDVRRLIERARAQDAEQRPINIQINLDNVGARGDGKGDRTGFDIRRSKVFWFLVIAVLSAGSAYARSRYVCQNFRDEGRFFYGMSINRCVGLLIKEPLATVEQHLAKVNGSY